MEHNTTFLHNQKLTRQYCHNYYSSKSSLRHKPLLWRYYLHAKMKGHSSAPGQISICQAAGPYPFLWNSFLWHRWRVFTWDWDQQHKQCSVPVPQDVHHLFLALFVCVELSLQLIYPWLDWREKYAEDSSVSLDYLFQQQTEIKMLLWWHQIQHAFHINSEKKRKKNLYHFFKYGVLNVARMITFCAIS